MITHIFLVGMPACGKSSFAKIVANHFGGQLIDTDQYLVSLYEKSVADLFQEFGQDWFRQQESIALRQIIVSNPEHKDSKLIISTGGGLPCFNQNMDFMLDNGLVIFLNVPLAILCARIMARKNHRPMFADLQTQAQIMDKLASVFQQRNHFYSRAQIHLRNTEAINSLQIIEKWFVKNDNK